MSNKEYGHQPIAPRPSAEPITKGLQPIAPDPATWTGLQPISPAPTTPKDEGNKK